MSPASPASSRQPLPGWMRWLHTYLSMLGLATLLFFSVTGLTLNHADWTLGSRRRDLRLEGRLETRWLAAGQAADAVDKLAIVEQLRRTHQLTGLVDEFRVDDTECSISFKGPGTAADAFIQRPTGAYQLSISTEGWLAVVNDLHKGRHTGRPWGWVIDVSAILLTLVSLTGLWLLFYVRRRRASGLWIGLAGTLVLALFYWLAVP